MDQILAKDMMIPIENYATVSENATLAEAVKALREAQKSLSADQPQHRAILVFNNRGKIVGKVSQFDVLQALEPKYQDVGDFKELDGYAINADYIRNLIKELGLLRKPVDDIFRKAAAVRVKTIMQTPTKGEFVNETAGLNEVIIQLLVGKHQSLLVTQGNDIVGILRLTDVFAKVADMIIFH